MKKIKISPVFASGLLYLSGIILHLNSWLFRPENYMWPSGPTASISEFDITLIVVAFALVISGYFMSYFFFAKKYFTALQTVLVTLALALFMGFSITLITVQDSMLGVIFIYSYTYLPGVWVVSEILIQLHRRFNK